MDIAVQEIIQQRSGANKPEWQLFYIDEKDDHRVYLISKDFMAPPTTGTEMTHSSNSNYPKAYKWNATVLNKYKTNLPAITATEPLGKFMRDYLSDYVGASASEQINLQATNYMLDQTMWSEYKGTKADLAFGGPTLPLFQASYNDICRKSTKLGIQKSGSGYQINQGGGSWEHSMREYGDTNTQRGIYFMGDDYQIARGIWIASPSSGNDEAVVFVYWSGCVNWGYATEYDYNLGFRPIISLNSNVVFIENEDGTYTIS